MKASTEEFLYVLLWTADSLLHPTWRNLNDGFEAWTWRNGLGRRVAELQRQHLVESVPEHLAHCVVRLTNAGRLAALGGRDPDEQWNRAWDEQWRMVLFDIPERQRPLRIKLWRNLRRQGFGYLQNSVWITPDRIDRERLAHTAAVPSVENVIVIQGRPCTGELDEAVVKGSWDFDRVNEAYRQCQEWLRRAPPADRGFTATREWAQAERTAWTRAAHLDPFLPGVLLPKGYLGRQVWRQRQETLQRLGRQLAGTAA